MRERARWLGLFTICWLALGGTALAASCGDTTGGGGTDVVCSCGDRATTNTTLTAADPVTTTLCPGRGLEIAPGVVVDMGGRTIQAAPGNTDVGALMANNSMLSGPGSAIGFRFGVTTFANHVGQTVTNVHARANEWGFALFRTATLRNNRASGNGTDGFLIFGGGCTLDSNVSEGNGKSGIDLFFTSENVVSANVLENNAAHGLVARDANVILENAARGNGLDGFVILGDGNEVNENRSEGNGRHGFEVEGNDNVLVRNSAKLNAGETEPQSVGFLLDGDRFLLERNVADSNEDAGFLVDPSNDSVFIRNLSRRNGGDGFLLLGTGNELVRNTASDNGGDGINVNETGAPGDNEDLGRNFGRRNGGVQCEIDGESCLP